LIQTQVTKQQGETKRREQEAKQIRSALALNASRSEQNITVIRGDADAQAKLLIAKT
jgi:hypothetical protein